MKTDDYGQIILSELDLCEIFLRNPEMKLQTALVEHDITFDPELEIQNLPVITKYSAPTITVADFDSQNQSNWHMPEQYKNMNIAEWILDQCETDDELQRVGTELLLYQERNLFPLLQYLKYLVDTMRNHGVVWGVGRGSSVSSYVLFLIGVHKINSMFYDLDVREFLR